MTARTPSAPPQVAVLPDDAGSWLLPAARAAIARELGARTPTPTPTPIASPAPAWAVEHGACFVTLTTRSLGDRLRGCIGSLSPWRPLADDVVANAADAATRDSRFPPVSRSELEDLRVEVSVLSETEPVRFDSEEDLRDRLRPGVDGLILSWRGRRGTFLPQVWEQLPDPERFLNQLKVKAGLRPGWWDDRAEVARYTVASWKEP